MKVFKFGGASVKDTEAVRNVGNILKSFQHEKLIVVISAMGKTTNLLEELTKAYCNQDKANQKRLFEQFKNFHFDILNELFGLTVEKGSLDFYNELFDHLELLLDKEPNSDYNLNYDLIVPNGELLSTSIVSNYLRDIGIINDWHDARKIVITDKRHREAVIDWSKSKERIDALIKPRLEKGLVNLCITQGFIGATEKNIPTTLGREGSDYTAAVLASILDVKEVIFWKDVSGIFNADPKEFSFAKQIPEISYYEAIEMTYYGAKVLHTKTIKPIENKQIPLVVRSFEQIDKEGTIIRKRTNQDTYPPIVIQKDRQILITITTKDLSFISEEHLSLVYGMFARHHIKINIVQISAVSFSVCCDYRGYKINPLLSELEKHFDLETKEGLTLLTVRHYNFEILFELSKGKNIYVEQKSKKTYQLVMD